MGAYRGGVFGNSFGFYTPIKTLIKKLKLKVSRIWNLSWSRNFYVIVSHIIGLKYDFGEKIEIL